MSSPNLNSLKMFDAAARHLNFRLAAQELHLTQGAVAQQVRRLESDLEQPLFYRQARGLKLTEAGLQYYQSIAKALTIIDQATAQLRLASSSVTISVPPSFATKWLVPRLSDFLTTHPHIEIHIMASETLANFVSDGVDLSIRQTKAPFETNLHYQLLNSLKLWAVCNAEYAKKIGDVTQLQSLAKHQLIQDGHKSWENLLRDECLKPTHSILQFNQTALAMDAASNGQGIALVPRILLRSQNTPQNLIKVWEDDRAHHSGYYIVYPKHHKNNPARDKFITWLLTEIEKDNLTSS